MRWSRAQFFAALADPDQGNSDGTRRANCSNSPGSNGSKARWAAWSPAETLQDVFQGCVAALVNHVGAAFARVWTLDESGQMLVLRASAGMYTHLDGPHGRVPVGQFKIGLIASEKMPHLTNHVQGDPRVGDQAWARRERMVAFAGYPLLVGGELHGVLAMFSREKLSEGTLGTLALVANTLAITVRQRAADAERIRLLEEAQAARETAEQASRAKDEFIAVVSHELRTPLNAILGWARLLGAGGLDGKELAEAVAVIERNALSQAQLIEDLLDVSRIISGKLRLDLRTVDVPEIVQDAVRAVLPARGEPQHPHRERARPARGSGLGRPRPAAADRVEPAFQRVEVHAQGRQGAGAAGAGQFARRVDRQRHGHRHRGGVFAARVRAVHAGG